MKNDDDDNNLLLCSCVRYCRFCATAEGATVPLRVPVRTPVTLVPEDPSVNASCACSSPSSWLPAASPVPPQVGSSSEVGQGCINLVHFSLGGICLGRSRSHRSCSCGVGPMFVSTTRTASASASAAVIEVVVAAAATVSCSLFVCAAWEAAGVGATC